MDEKKLMIFLQKILEPKTYIVPQEKKKRLAIKKTKHPVSEVKTTIEKKSNEKVFLSEEKREVKKIKCKFCKKEFPEHEIDDKGYCSKCAENWWNS